MYVIGIDPGGQGACVHGTKDQYILKLSKATDADIVDWFKEDIHGGHYVAYLEKPTPQPKNGAKANWKVGYSYGQLLTCCLYAGFKVVTVSPAKWQRYWGLPTGKEAGSDTAKKRAHKAKAQELFPDVKVTNETADALLIYEYGKEMEK